MIHKLRILQQNYYYERREGFWIVYILHDPTFRYGTRLLLHDDGRATLEILRPGEQDIRELK